MFLLDTVAVSDLRKAGTPHEDSGLTAWATDVPAVFLYISVVTVQEIETGILRVERRETGQATALRDWFENQVLTAFQKRTLPVDLDVARTAAALHVPDPRPTADALIAATALNANLTVVTRNTADFGHMVAVHNPWAP